MSKHAGRSAATKFVKEVAAASGGGGGGGGGQGDGSEGPLSRRELSSIFMKVGSDCCWCMKGRATVLALEVGRGGVSETGVGGGGGGGGQGVSCCLLGKMQFRVSFCLFCSLWPL